MHEIKTYSTSADYLGQQVDVVIDRPLGSRHPKHADIIYSVNYGYVPGTRSGDGEELGAYVLGVDAPLEKFTGVCIAMLRRKAEDDDRAGRARTLTYARGPRRDRRPFWMAAIVPAAAPWRFVLRPVRKSAPSGKARRQEIGGHGRNRTGVHGFAGRCVTTPPRGQSMARHSHRVDW